MVCRSSVRRFANPVTCLPYPLSDGYQALTSALETAMFTLLRPLPNFPFFFLWCRVSFRSLEARP